MAAAFSRTPCLRIALALLLVMSRVSLNDASTNTTQQTLESTVASDGSSLTGSSNANHGGPGVVTLQDVLSFMMKQELRNDERHKDTHTQIAGLVTQVAGLTTQVAGLTTQVAALADVVADQGSTMITPKEMAWYDAIGREHVWLVRRNNNARNMSNGSGFFMTLGSFGTVFITAAHVLCPSMDLAVCGSLSGDDTRFGITRRSDSKSVGCIVNAQHAAHWIALDLWPARCGHGSFTPVPLEVDSANLQPGHALVSMGVARDQDASRLGLHFLSEPDFALQIRTGVVVSSAGVAKHDTVGRTAACRLDSNGTGFIVRGALYSTLVVQDGMSGGPVMNKQRRVIAVNHASCPTVTSSVTIDLLLNTCRTIVSAGPDAAAGVVYKRAIGGTNPGGDMFVNSHAYTAADAALLSC